MKQEKIETIQKISKEIDNFNACYKDCKLYSNQYGDIKANTILSWLMEHPHMAEIAANIKKMEA